MRRLKKKIYLGLCATTFVVLAAVRYTSPSVVGERVEEQKADSTENIVKTAPIAETENVDTAVNVVNASPVVSAMNIEPADVVKQPKKKHRIRGVHSYSECFPDVQDVQIVPARRWGVRPVANREQAEHRKQELVFIGSNPYFVIDKGMSHSIPYLVPRAATLLERIGRNFLDSLYVKDVPFHRIIVTSVLRTQSDLERLKRINPNVSAESCHRFGTTFDIAYNRYNTVCPPGEHRREVGSDTLKYVLSEVLRDLREAEHCYVKYEVKQGCFHITTR